METVRLKKKSLRISANLREQLFGKHQFAFGSFKPEQKMLVLAGVESPFFAKVHQPEQYFMKQVSAAGEVSIPVHDLELDHEIQLEEGELPAEINTRTGIMKIYFSTSL